MVETAFLVCHTSRFTRTPVSQQGCWLICTNARQSPERNTGFLRDRALTSSLRTHRRYKLDRSLFEIMSSEESFYGKNA
jgi:hypothetical protein